MSSCRGWTDSIFIRETRLESGCLYLQIVQSGTGLRYNYEYLSSNPQKPHKNMVAAI